MPSRRFALTFGSAFLGLGTMVSAWILATPMAAGPDEPQHVIQATALVRGQFDEPQHQTVIGRVASVKVPSWTARLVEDQPCYVQWPATSVGCIKSLGDSNRIVTGATQFSNAPPLYYAVVGAPTLFFAGTGAVYTMRLVGGLLEVALVSLGLALLDRFHPRRSVFVGALFALTPMSLFLMAPVTSSGLETSAAFATWCAGLCVVEYPRLPRALAVWSALPAVVLVLARPASPLDLLVVVIVLGFLVGWRGVRTRTNRSLLPLVVPVACAALVAALVLAVGGPPSLLGFRPAHPAGVLSNVWSVVRLTPGYLYDVVGTFGLSDVRPPTWVVGVWAAVVGGLILAALVRSAPCRRALPILILAVLLVPQLLETPEMNTVYAYFAGRYLVPVAIGLPLVASTFSWRPRNPRALPSVTAGLGVVWVAAQAACFSVTLTRNETVLTSGPGTPAKWLPPGGTVPVTLLLIAGGIVTVALVAVSSGRTCREGLVEAVDGDRPVSRALRGSTSEDLREGV